jgi:hypothetical protein
MVDISAAVIIGVIVIGTITIGVNHHAATEKHGRKYDESDTHGESPGGCAILLAHPVMVVK